MVGDQVISLSTLPDSLCVSAQEKRKAAMSLFTRRGEAKSERQRCAFAQSMRCTYLVQRGNPRQWPSSGPRIQEVGQAAVRTAMPLAVPLPFPISTRQM